MKYLLQTSKALSSVEAKLAVKQGLHTASMLAELLKDEHMPRVGRALEEAAEAVNRAQGWDGMAGHGTARSKCMIHNLHHLLLLLPTPAAPYSRATRRSTAKKQQRPASAGVQARR